MQYLLTAVIILCALGYTAWRMNDIFRKGGDPCKGCVLKGKCHHGSPQSCLQNSHSCCH